MLMTNFNNSELVRYKLGIKLYKEKTNDKTLYISDKAYDRHDRLIDGDYSLHCTVRKEFGDFWKILEDLSKSSVQIKKIISDITIRIESLTEDKMFKKSDFKNGMVILLDTGKKRLFWEDKFIDAHGFIPLHYYNDQLNNIDRIHKDENIEKIFTSHGVGYFEDFFRGVNLTEIWSRN